MHIAVTVLTSAKTTTPLDQFEDGFADVLNRYSAPETTAGPDGEVLDTELPLAALHRGRWSPMDPETGRTLELAKKKQARRARVVAGMAAEDLTELLLSATPEDCYADLYGALWRLATAWGFYADGVANAKGGSRPRSRSSLRRPRSPIAACRHTTSTLCHPRPWDRCASPPRGSAPGLRMLAVTPVNRHE